MDQNQANEENAAAGPAMGGASKENLGDLGQELRQLGQNLKSILQAAWESEDRKKVQQEIEAGMSELASVLSQAAHEFRASPAGQQLEAEIGEMRKRWRSGEAGAEFRREVVSVLQRVNQEIERSTSGRKPSAGQGEEI